MILLSSQKDYAYIFHGRAAEQERLEKQAKQLDLILEKELELIKLQPGMQVLDAGCGSGAVTRKMARIVSPGTVTGVDLSFLEEARTIAKKENLTNIRYEEANINKLPFPDGKFDVTYSRLVMMHLPDPVKSLREMKRVTRKDGIVAVSDFDDATLIWYPAVPELEALWKSFGDYSKSIKSDRFVGRKLSSLLSQAGLSQVKVHPHTLSATRDTPEGLAAITGIFSGILEEIRDELIKEGFTSRQKHDQGMREWEILRNDPGTFITMTQFLAIGHVP